MNLRSAIRRVRRSAAAHVVAAARVDAAVDDMMILGMMREQLTHCAGQAAVGAQPDATPDELIEATRAILRSTALAALAPTDAPPTSRYAQAIADIDRAAIAALRRSSRLLRAEAATAADLAADFAAATEAGSALSYNTAVAIALAGIDLTTLRGARLARVYAAFAADESADLAAAHSRALVAEHFIDQYSGVAA